MRLCHVLSIISSSMTRQAKPQTSKQSDSPIAITSMVLGVVSLTGAGFVLGIPAIILAIIALKKDEGGRNLSITGLVTGIVSTILSLLFVAFIMFVAWGLETNTQQAPQQEHFESTKA